MLRQVAEQLGVAIDDRALAELGAYLVELDHWSRHVNLVSQRDLERFVERHIVDSLVGAPALAGLGSSLEIADIGSGNGLPGVPLAIVLRPRRMLLVEARRKRASFLRAVARRLSDVPLEVRNVRAENLATSEPATLDAVVSRAAIPVSSLLAIAGRLLRPGGLLILHRELEASLPDPGRSLVIPQGLGDPQFDGPSALRHDIEHAARTPTCVVWRRQRST